MKDQLVAALAGAGLVALLDSALRIPADAPGFWREATLLVVAGDLAVAAALIVAVHLAGRIVKERYCPRTWFWMGIFVGLGPFLSFKLPNLWFGVLVVTAGFFLAPALGRRWAPPAVTRAFLAVLAPAAALFAAVQPPSQAPRLPARAAPVGASAAGRPDVLLISADTLRADEMVAAPGPLPAWESLCRRGTWADYALSSSSATRPGHFTMLSGLSAIQHSVTSNEMLVGGEFQLLAQRFAAAGYRTAAVVSNAVIGGDSGFRAGFEVYDDSPVARRGPRQSFEEMIHDHSWVGWLGPERLPSFLRVFLFGSGSTVLHGDAGNARHTTERALALLAGLRRDSAPYFLFVHYMDPHAPYWPPPQTAGRYFRGADLPPGFLDPEVRLGEFRMINRLGRKLAEGNERARALVGELRKLYQEEILFLDQQVGELLRAVASGGRPTVVLWTADHGEQFGEHDLVVHSNSVYEPLLRVPLALAGPGVPARKLEVTPHLEDVVPTLLSLAGIPWEGLVGRDLSAADVAPRPHFERYKTDFSFRDAEWKLICDLSEEDGGRVRLAARELYHLAADPGELDNLLDSEVDLAARMLQTAQSAADAFRLSLSGQLDADPAHQAALQELGYADGGS